jgi:hypothetical protein
MLREFILAVAKAREVRTPTELHRLLDGAGFKVSHQAVFLWWAGSTRRFDDERAAALIDALALTPAEIARLREVQSGMALPPEKDAAPNEAA